MLQGLWKRKAVFNLHLAGDIDRSSFLAYGSHTGDDSDGEPRRWRRLAEFSSDRDREWQLWRTGQSRQWISVMCASLCPNRNEGWGENHFISQAVGVVRTMCAGRG